MKFMLKGCDQVGHKNFTPVNCKSQIYHKKLPKQTRLSLFDSLLQHTQDLNNHTNGTKRGFPPLILERNLKLMDGPYMKNEGEMIPFWYHHSCVWYHNLMWLYEKKLQPIWTNCLGSTLPWIPAKFYSRQTSQFPFIIFCIQDNRTRGNSQHPSELSDTQPPHPQDPPPPPIPRIPPQVRIHAVPCHST